MSAYDAADSLLADLVALALARLQVEMTTAKNSRDRIAAANSILDRAGISRTPRANAQAADEQILRAIQQVTAGTLSSDQSHALEAMARELDQHEAASKLTGPGGKKLTRKEQAAADQAAYDAARAEEDAEMEVRWEEAAPEPEPEVERSPAMILADEIANSLDYTQLGPDDEETDAWLDA